MIIADVVSDVGAFMQSTGAAWLMVSLNAGPMYVALTQTASALPFFLFALPAGAIGDIVDRRKLILYTETWMAGVALVLAVLTIGGLVGPLSLLILTFALSAGDAFETPSWRAVLPDLVKKEDLPAASALNGIEFNFARAVGPGLAGLVIAAAGADHLRRDGRVDILLFEGQQRLNAPRHARVFEVAQPLRMVLGLAPFLSHRARERPVRGEHGRPPTRPWSPQRRGLVAGLIPSIRWVRHRAGTAVAGRTRWRRGRRRSPAVRL